MEASYFIVNSKKSSPFSSSINNLNILKREIIQSAINNRNSINSDSVIESEIFTSTWPYPIACLITLTDLFIITVILSIWLKNLIEQHCNQYKLRVMESDKNSHSFCDKLHIITSLPGTSTVTTTAMKTTATSTVRTNTSVLLSMPTSIVNLTPTNSSPSSSISTVSTTAMSTAVSTSMTTPSNDWVFALHVDLQTIQPLSAQSQSESIPNPNLYQKQSPSENKENKAPYSPLVASASYKHGNYFRFPEVDCWSPGIKSGTKLLINSDSPTIGILTPTSGIDSASTIDLSRNSPTARRARLKSISLDSESARFVEENLNLQMDELQLENRADLRLVKSRNKNQLTIDLAPSIASSSVSVVSLNGDLKNLSEIEQTEIQQPTTPKTPTFTQTRQKAISLDSDQIQPITTQSLNNIPVASVSVPTTPKRQQQSISSSIIQQQQKQQQQLQQRITKSRNTVDHLGSNLQRLKAITLSVSNNNLKTLPEVMPLSDFGGGDDGDGGVSEIITDNVCGKNLSQKCTTNKAKSTNLLQRRGSNHSLSLNLAGSFGDLVSNHSLSSSTNQTKKGLLQRRGSNASLTLTIQCSDAFGLSRFNSHGSLNTGNHSGIEHAVHSGGISNVGVDGRSPSASVGRKGILSVSNCCLRGSSNNLSKHNNYHSVILDTTQMSHNLHDHNNYRRHHHHQYQHNNHRKFLSSENLLFQRCTHHSPQQITAPLRSSISSTVPSLLVANSNNSYGFDDNIGNDEEDNVKNIENVDIDLDAYEYCTNAPITDDHNSIKQITTKPLSPQSTSEDFKIYLANIQFLQNATNVRDVNDIRNLIYCFIDLMHYQLKQTAKNINLPSTSTSVAPTQIGTGMITTTESSTLNLTYDQEELINQQKRKLRQIHQEFWDLPTNHQEKPMVFNSQLKNRYKTILPNEHSRVILMQEYGCNKEQYINANYIKGPDGTHNAYIATQGPMPNTIYDFWLMVMQNADKCQHNLPQKICMLTDFIENGRTKCSVYFPQDHNQIFTVTNSSRCIDHNYQDKVNDDENNSDNTNENEDFLINKFKKYIYKAIHENNTNDLMELCKKIRKNLFIIHCIEIINKQGYTIRQLTIHYCNNTNVNNSNYKKFKVMHYWFPDWPDHRSPDDLNVVLDFSLDVLDFGSANNDYESDEIRNEVKPIKVNGKINHSKLSLSPLLILHCSAGIGRTGCMAGILNALRQINLNVNHRGNPTVDILGIVCNLRLQRGGMVQNSEQYELIHRVLCLYQQRLDELKGILPPESFLAK